MKTSLAKISFYNILATAIIFSIVLGFFTYKITNDSYEQRVTELEQNYMQKNKELVKTEVLRIIKRIETVKSLSYDTHLSILEEKVDFMQSMISLGYKNNLDIKSLINKYREEFDLFKWDNGTGYFYIFDSKGIILYHGSSRELEKKNIFELTTHNKELRTFLHETIKRTEHLGKYKWYKPNTDLNQLYTKYVHVKKHLGYGIYIAAGIYKEELDKKIQKVLFKEIENDKFGDNKYGYFWIHELKDKNIKMLMHPYSKSIVNKDITEFITLDGQYLFKNMNKIVNEKKGGYINYIWYLPNKEQKEQDEKTSYVHLIKDWNLVIGSGFYLTELNAMLQSERAKLKESLNNNLQKILWVLFVLILVSLLAARYVARRIQTVEIAQKEHFNMLEQYKQILDKSAIVSKTDKDGNITYVNSSFLKVSGYTKDEVLFKAHSIIRHPDTPKSQFKKLWSNIKSGIVWNGVLKNKRKDGDSYYCRSTILPIKDANGKIIEYISSATDITELIDNRSKLQNIFRTDPLTGLGNRVSLIDNISKVNDGTLVLLNIDRFKEVNDSYGHNVGDKVITELGQRLFEFFSDSKYTLYRVQADVFALYTDNQTSSKVYERVDKFIKTVGVEPYKIDDYKFILTYSAGIASQGKDLFSYADIALSEAKNKNIKIKEYDPSMKNIEEFKNNLEWVEKLHLAITEDRLVPYYQPIYNYHTKRIEKYECLMRLIDHDKIISPDDYLSIAKKTRLYPELTYKIAEKAITKFATNDKEFSINLSVEDLMNEELMIFIYDYAEQKDVFSRMVLEIVESEEIEDSDIIMKTIKKFKDRGSKVAIDDFGSGYSNYDYLIKLQADYIKIDESIVNHLLEDERTQDVVKSIVSFAKKSNMKTIAEYVASKELNQLIESLDVDYAQGYYYGKAEEDLIS